MRQETQLYSVALTAANNGQILQVTGVSITSYSPACTSPVFAKNVTLAVNPTPSLTGASQLAAVCVGSSAQINLTGLVASSTSTVTYTINGGPVQTVTGVVATAGGAGSFNTIALTFANNGQVLQVTGITITSATPNCSQSFTQNVTLAVNVTPALSRQFLTPPPVCSGSTFSYAATSATTGATFTWSRAAVAGITPATSSGTGNVNEVLTNTTASPIIVTYKYITTANTCSNAPGESITVSVNPAPTIAPSITQAGTACAGSGGIINLTGLLPGTTSTIYYVINNVAQTPITGVVASGTGTATFTSANLTIANNGQILKIIGISNTVFTPACIKTVSALTLLSVNAVPTLTSAAQAAAICAGAPATINLTGLVASSLNNTINYTIAGVAQPAVTGVNADAAGNASFNTSILTPANNGQTLTITGITNATCSKVFSVNATLTVGSSNVWLGVNTNWFDVQNWCGGIPTIISNVIIPSGLVNYPILTTGVATVNDIAIQNAASVIVGTATLQVAGTITNTGTGILNASNGTIEFKATAAQNIAAGTFMNNAIKDLVITNTAGVTLGGAWMFIIVNLWCIKCETDNGWISYLEIYGYRNCMDWRYDRPYYNR